MKHKFTYNQEDVPRANLIEILGRMADRNNRIKAIVSVVFLDMAAMSLYFVMALSWGVMLPRILLWPIILAPIIHGVVILWRVKSIEEFQLNFGCASQYLVAVSLLGAIICLSTMTKYIVFVAIMSIAALMVVQYLIISNHLFGIRNKKAKKMTIGSVTRGALLAVVLSQSVIIILKMTHVEISGDTTKYIVVIVYIIFIWLGIPGMRFVVNYYLIKKMGISYPEGINYQQKGS